MISRFALFAGYRSFAQARQTRLVSFISMLAIIGLIFGVSLLITVLSVMNGFDHEMKTRILGQVPHIRLFRPEGIQDWQLLQQQLSTTDGIKTAEPYARLEGLLSGNGQAVPIELEGLDLQSSPEVKQLIPDLPVANPNGLYLAAGVAKQLGLDKGKQVTLLIPGSQSNITGATGFKAQGFTIRGIFETQTALDQFLVIAPLATVSHLGGLEDSIQGFRLQMDDIFNTRAMGFQLIRQLPPGFSFNDWLQTHGNLYQAIKMSKNLVMLLVFLIMGVAVFNVVSMLVMTVIDKKSAIAIYKTLGASRSEVMAIFIVQGLLIGFVGTALGCVIGIALTLSLDVLVGVLEAVLNRKLLDPSVYPVSFLPVLLRWQDVVLISGVSMLFNFVSTLYPAWRAASTQPAKVLSQD